MAPHFAAISSRTPISGRPSMQSLENGRLRPADTRTRPFESTNGRTRARSLFTRTLCARSYFLTEPAWIYLVTAANTSDQHYPWGHEPGEDRTSNTLGGCSKTASLTAY